MPAIAGAELAKASRQPADRENPDQRHDDARRDAIGRIRRVLIEEGARPIEPVRKVIVEDRMVRNGHAQMPVEVTVSALVQSDPREDSLR